MKIGIEASKIHVKDGGFGIYPKKLLENLLLLDNTNYYYIFVSEIKANLQKFNNCEQILVKSSVGTINSLKFYFAFHNLIKKYKLDILHLLSAYGIYKSPCPTISTIFDLRYFAVPELKERKFGKFIYKYIIPFLIKPSCHLVSISKTTKSDLIKYLNIAEDKITVIPLGHDMFLSTQSNHEEIELPQKYFFWVGMITKRKNLETLYMAYKKYLDDCGNNIPLVILGSFSNHEIEVTQKKLIGELGIKDKVIFLGHIANEINLFYKNAIALIFPSIYEGFGIPIIEAMASGVPVITSKNGGATKEVGSGAGIMVDPYDVDALADAMHEVLTNDGLREDMIKKGLERAKMFSWEKCARETLGIYEEAYHGDRLHKR